MTLSKSGIYHTSKTRDYIISVSITVGILNQFLYELPVRAFENQKLRFEFMFEFTALIINNNK